MEPVTPTATATGEPDEALASQPAATPGSGILPALTPTPAPSPTPSPTPEPAIPFEPVVTCGLVEGAARPVAGAWSFQECAVRWATRNVSAVEVNAWTGETGWRVIAVDANALNHPEVLDASDGVLGLSDDVPEDDGFLGGRFQLGTRLGCASPVTATVHLEFTATSAASVVAEEEDALNGDQPGAPVIETYRLDRNVERQGPAPPDVSIQEIAFTSVEPVPGPRTTSGIIRIAYTGASACEWRVNVTIGDFQGSEGRVVPASRLTGAAIRGVPGAAISGEHGRYVIAVPGGREAGELILTVSLELPGPLVPGTYTTSVEVTAVADP